MVSGSWSASTMLQTPIAPLSSGEISSSMQFWVRTRSESA